MSYPVVNALCPQVCYLNDHCQIVRHLILSIRLFIWSTFYYLYGQFHFYMVFQSYQPSWQRKLATINSFKADASSVSPSSERLEKLWVVCVFAVFTRFKRRPRINAALESSWFSRNVARCFTDQTRLSEGNFPFNLDNTLSIIQFPLTA